MRGGYYEYENHILLFSVNYSYFLTSLGGSVIKKIHLQDRGHKRGTFDPWVEKIPWRRAWQPTPVYLPGESHGQRSLVGYIGLQRVGHDRVTEHACLILKIFNILIF